MPIEEMFEIMKNFGFYLVVATAPLCKVLNQISITFDALNAVTVV